MASALATTARTGAGTVPGSSGTGSRTCLSTTSSGVSPVNGGFPASSSYSTTPTEYRSDAAEASLPSARSGAMYRAVPITAWAVVIRVSARVRAMPKSVTVTRPS